MREPYSTDNIRKPFNRGDSPSTSVDPTQQGRGTGAGLFHEPLIEPIPQRIISESETSINNGNSWIVLGRDRPASLGSGYGALGVNGASSIDLCVGMMAVSKTGPKQEVKVHPNFASDAARIYISQKTDLDNNFGIADGKQEKLGFVSSKGNSGIGIKADGVRIIARQNGIKLVTGKGNFNNTGNNCETNSSGNNIVPNDLGSIELIAGNDTTELALSELLSPAVLKLINLFTPIKLPNKIRKLQPIPKGDNLVHCLKYILNIIDTVIVKINVLSQLFVEFMAMVPPSLIPLPGSAGLALGSGINITRLLTEIMISTNPLNGSLKQQLNSVENNYLEPIGMFYINSRYCRLT
jgi:hypothetical protein